MKSVSKDTTSFMSKRLSTKQFVISQVLILIFGLILAGLLYYYLNYYKQENNSYLSRGGPVTTQPNSITLDLTSPSDDLLTFSDEVLFSGKTVPFSSVLIMSNTQNVVAEVKSDGTFSKLITLDEGVNVFEIIVFDKTGEERSLNRTIYYSEEKI